MSIYSMFVLLGMVATASAQITLTNCATDADCQTYSDTAATCISSACSCTAPDTTDFCSANSTGTTGVSYVFTFTFDCDAFFSSATLQNTLRVAVERTMSGAGEITYEITFSCGSVNMIVSGADVPVADVATLGADLTTSVTTSVTGTDMENTLATSSASVDAGTSTTVCNVTSPDASAVYINTTDTCSVTGCVSGYELQSNAPNYIATCVEVAVSGSDDDLSNGAIAAIVMGCVGVLVVTIAAVLIVFSKKPEDAEEKETAKVTNEPFDDVLV